MGTRCGLTFWYCNTIINISQSQQAQGGIVARFVVGDSSTMIYQLSTLPVLEVAASARQNAVCHRNDDVAGMLEEKAVFSPTIDHAMAYIGGGDGTMVLNLLW
jgi:hypothetical protein